jgi:hypothetical protein
MPSTHHRLTHTRVPRTSTSTDSVRLLNPNLDDLVLLLTDRPSPLASRAKSAMTMMEKILARASERASLKPGDREKLVIILDHYGCDWFPAPTPGQV